MKSVLEDYFRKDGEREMSVGKEFMDVFIKNGILNKDYKEGLGIGKIVRGLDDEN